MAVQAQFGGLAGCLLPHYGGGGGLAEEQLQALLSAAAGNKQAQVQQQYHCAAGGVASAAQSELTCNGGGMVASRKRSRDGADLVVQQYHHYVPSSSAALLPIPGAVAAHKPASAANVPSGSRMADDSAVVSTSGRGGGPSSLSSTAVDAVLAAELRRHGAEVDALVRAGCESLRAGLELARKRECEAVARAAASCAARALREKEAELDAARRRAQELEERLRQAAAETQAWCGLARSNEAAASGLRATLDALLLRAGAGAGVGCGGTAAQHVGEQQQEEEGFGESAAGGGADDAESCCFADRAVAQAPAAKWACRACGAGEASVLVLPCRHLCLCKACEPRVDACPVCSGDKNAAIHIAPN